MQSTLPHKAKTIIVVKTMPVTELWVDEGRTNTKIAKQSDLRILRAISKLYVSCTDDHSDMRLWHLHSNATRLSQGQYPDMESPTQNDWAESLKKIYEATVYAKGYSLESPSKSATDNAERLLKENDLAEAMQELNEAEADAEEDGLEVPSKLAIDNAERLLKEMYTIAPQRFTVYPVSEGYIAIDARGQGISGRIAVVMCGSDGEVLCLVTIDGEHRRAHYSSARDLPDGFIREALASL